MSEQINKNNNNSYTASDIYVLEGLEPVRKRPGMYIGSTGVEGLHHLIWEVVDNSLDEAIGGYCDEIVVTFSSNNRMSVQDNGRGIPVDIHKQTGKSALETVLTTLHAGAKFGGQSYKIAGGLHGVGVSVVCALSRWLKAEVHRDGDIYTQEYEFGRVVSPVKKVGSTDRTGTTITFEPDPEIFKDAKFSWRRILDHLRQQSYLTRGVKIVIRDERKQSTAKDAVSASNDGNKFPPIFNYSYTFYFEGGLPSFVKYLNQGEKIKHENIFHVSEEKEDIAVEVAVQYTQDIQGKEVSFANNIHTGEGGMHLTGFRTALTRTLNDYARKNSYLKENEENLSGDDVREGLTAVISVKIKEPQFEGQTKAKLGNPEARVAVDAVMAEAFANYLERFPQDARAIMEKCLLAAKARRAAKAARETVIRKGVLEGLALPGKLADCSSRRPEESEIFIVEGDSAGGSTKQARDRRFQAVLPIRGKILNVEKARLNRALASKEIRALVIAMGTAIAEEFNIAKLRYHRVIIMTDADVDGAHIRTLLLTLFFRHFEPLIKAGHIYIAQPPLYRIQIGSQVEYMYDDIAKDKKLAGLTQKFNLQRYKGLGEMNPNQLWETTMDPAKRILKQVTVDDAEAADHIFDVLMGSEVAPRKKFIQTHAKTVQNLDV
ncbi:MAG: DNA topoisomerase (ATP-hydrolyzing) subunit B [Candidatus Portnoybacteria bacterium CG06_land_8_20_14_3_00_39_12]|uniref:DNA gyrase subunit B n=3 Tax=Candidatus Portnoyibacteriota TaxID=1817913 RepID=A0A2M8KGW2_9BACT|nr:MAG: DNA topoisomerase (ATP-hydrolyzing) subunit B [Candidatus Portnoybacteria bacterium CG06_land_8_20_14_3_00_39_12]PIZ71082.1 MAG: DNA topoisomerase (ATP-hydrolyzing) subunit B [Candidatus Portnoybacteria bacterium CG_4_10_14_0_2_um_filter_39_11]PJE59149.1 MAG: DNA topoisomerase (ATP-hydrolyzing) subunit B [Candidatus Portnoybacteria bacterium CG10_big_fil_rev_8_21_14_0_10_40_22]